MGVGCEDFAGLCGVIAAEGLVWSGLGSGSESGFFQ